MQYDIGIIGGGPAGISAAITAASKGRKVVLFEAHGFSPIVECCIEGSGVHMYVGKGGAPEGVLGAVAVKCLGGDMQARLCPEDDAQVQRCLKMGIADVNTESSIHKIN